jgi:outer membrane protein OmpA-like peptidoglycan-associated protein
MKALAALLLVVPLAARAAPASRAPNEYCNPCTLPCSPDEGCGAKPAPAPVAKPPPPAPPPVVMQPSAAATFSPAAGTYPSAQTVELSTTTPGATIHYTTDGSEPTAASPVYTGPIAVGSSTTVKAITVAPGMASSVVSSATYAVEPPPPPVVAAPPPPPAPPPRVEVTKEKLELKDKVFFETGRSTIKPASYGLLDEVAQALSQHGEIGRVEIGGHTDALGAAATNQKLSQARAEAVRAYLVKKGVDGGRLEAKGYGPSLPVADNKTATGREANRRVEFVIKE